MAPVADTGLKPLHFNGPSSKDATESSGQLSKNGIKKTRQGNDSKVSGSNDARKSANGNEPEPQEEDGDEDEEVNSDEGDVKKNGKSSRRVVEESKRKDNDGKMEDRKGTGASERKTNGTGTTRSDVPSDEDVESQKDTDQDSKDDDDVRSDKDKKTEPPKRGNAKPRKIEPVVLPDPPVNPIKAPDLKPTENVEKVRSFRPDQITSQEWTMILNNSHFLHGFRSGFTGDGKIDGAAKAAFKPPASAEKTATTWPSCSVADKVELSITETSSIMEKNLTQQGFSAVEVETSVDATFEAFSVGVGGSVGNSKDVINSWAAKTETHTLIGKFFVPYLQLMLDSTTLDLSQDCEEQIKAIIATRDYDTLMRFFNDFGAIFPQRVLLGGQLWTSESLSATAGAARNDVLSKFSASLKATANVPMVVKGSLQSTYHKENREIDEKKDGTKTIEKRWSSWGGDDLLMTEPQRWRESVRNVANWRALEYTDLESMVTIIGRKHPFRDFPQIVKTILGLGKPAPMSLNLRCYVYDDVVVPDLDAKALGSQRPWKKLSLNQGLDSQAGQYRDRPIEHSVKYDVPRHTTPSETKWQVLDGIGALSQKLTTSIQGTEAQRFNITFPPLYLSHMKVSTDRPMYNFTVILEWSGEGRLYRPEKPEQIVLFPEAKETLLKSPNEFYVRYGDYFVSDLCRQTCATVVWTFSFGRNRTAMEDWRQKLRKELSVGTQTPESGAGFIRNLMKSPPAGTSCLVNCYLSSSNTGALVQVPETSNLDRTVSTIASHTNGSDDIITRVWVLPYSRSLINVIPKTLPDNECYLRWSSTLNKLYSTFNELRSLPSEVVFHAAAEKEMRDLETTLLMNQRRFLGGDLSSLSSVTLPLENLRARISLETGNKTHETAYLKTCMREWMRRSGSHEISAIHSLNNVAGQMTNVVAGLFLDFRGADKGYQKFGVTEAPSDWGHETKEKLKSLVIENPPQVYQYHHSFFDNEWRKDYVWSIEKAGHRLLAWDINNNWNQGCWHLGTQGKNETRVSQKYWRVSFQRTIGYSIKVNTWWVPEDMC